jgi:tRNA threonylcarbamoyladenosine biosynthesis protein TsaE
MTGAIHTLPDLRLILPDPEATDALGRALAAQLRPGDTLLLSGPIGAGKSHLARAVIRALLARAGAPDEDVPSPTYTLVQTYDAGPDEIWHADLYRLTTVDEVVELGLDAAFDTAICLVEWPDRLGDLAPEDALRIDLSTNPADEGRTAHLQAPSGRWSGILSRLAQCEAPIP